MIANGHPIVEDTTDYGDEAFAVPMDSYGGKRPPPDRVLPMIRTARELAFDIGDTRRSPIVHGLIGDKEIGALISAAKARKSWFILSMLLAVAAGIDWLGFRTERRHVLLIDNELHPDSINRRIVVLAKAMGLTEDDYADTLHVESLRGRLCDIDEMCAYFNDLEAGKFGMIVLDALYRFFPDGFEENSNGDMARLFNKLDKHACRLGGAWWAVHHSPKGIQSQKNVADVTAGAGSLSRAVDVLAVVRAHEDPEAFVLEFETRDCARPAPIGLRWEYPLLANDPHLDCTKLAKAGGKKESEVDVDAPWTVDRFVAEFLSPAGRIVDVLLIDAGLRGISGKKAEQLLSAAVATGKAFKWEFGRAVKVQYATVPQEKLLIDGVLEPKPRSSKGVK